MLRAALETLGSACKVMDVPSGEEAMLIISRQRVDLLIADVRLPGISGLELITRAQQRNQNLKLILVTGMTDPKIRKQAMDAQADAIFFKPVEIADFLDAVERCLGMKSPPSETASEPAPALKTPDLLDRLSSLRQMLRLPAVILLDGEGRVRARAGDLSVREDEAGLIAAVRAVFTAGDQVSTMMGKDRPQNLLRLTGFRLNIYAVQVGAADLLVLAAPPDEEEEQITKVIRSMRAAANELQLLLSTADSREVAPPPEPETGETIPPDAPAPQVKKAEPEPPPLPEVSEEALLELGSLLENAAQQHQAADVDAFWDSLMESETGVAGTNGEALSYEEARKLGLAPEEE